jgi:hypothetical protein
MEIFIEAFFKLRLQRDINKSKTPIIFSLFNINIKYDIV